MARQEKGTRQRLLPAREQTNARDSVSGSFPTVVRFSTDGRMGNGKGFFRDDETMVFGSTASTRYYPSIGLISGSYWLRSQHGPNDLDLSTTIITTGSVKASVIDELPYVGRKSSSSLRPFHDEGNPAVDGKSTSNPFFATGSLVVDIGEGFDSPLWSKQKIEISFDDDIGLELDSYAGSGGAATIAYRNFATSQWQALAGVNGGPYDSFGGLLRADDGMGFTPSMMTRTNGEEPSAKGVPTTTFGFPFHTKYEASTGQLLHMSGYINAPFALEKVVLEFTASLQIGFGEVWKRDTVLDADGNISNYSSSYAVTNFFILNQRRYQASSTRVYAGPRDDMDYYTNTFAVPDADGRNTIRDLIGWGSIASMNNAYGLAYTASVTPDALYGGRWKRDLNILDTVNSNATSSFWSGTYVLSFSVGAPKMYGELDYTTFPLPAYPDAYATQLFDGGIFTDWVGHVHRGGRNGLGLMAPAGRDLRGGTSTLTPSTKVLGSTGYVPIMSADSFSRKNPYVLLPSDKLVFGWHAPTLDDYAFFFNSIEGAPLLCSRFTIPVGPSKIYLYGSYIVNDAEHNDTLNQLLSTPGIHEVIE